MRYVHIHHAQEEPSGQVYKLDWSWRYCSVWLRSQDVIATIFMAMQRTYLSTGLLASYLLPVTRPSTVYLSMYILYFPLHLPVSYGPE